MRKILCALLGLLFTIPSFANCNLFNKNQELLHLAGTTGILGTNEHRDGVYIAIEPNTTYTLSNPDGIYINIVMTESLPTNGVRSLGYFNMATQNTYTFTSVENAHYAYLFTDEGSSFSNIIFERNMFNLSTATEGGLVDANNGTVVGNNSGFYASDYIPVQANETYIISPAQLQSSVYGMAWYDANKQYISGTLFNVDVLRVTAPANAAFARTSYASGWGDPFSFRPAYCSEIQVATTKYVETQFSDLGTRLAAAVATVNTVVTNTIAQAASIATLQSGKQTRPANDTCPAYKQCLLVEDESGTPHWYQITDPFRDFVAPIIANNVAPASTTNSSGFTQLQYIENTGTQWIDTGITTPASNSTVTKFEANVAYVLSASNQRNFIAGYKDYAHGHYCEFKDNKFGFNGSTGYYSPTLTAETPYDVTMQINGSNNVQLGINIDGTNYTKSFTEYQGDTMGQFVLFMLDSSFISKGLRMYSAKLTINNTLVRNFIPAQRNSDGAIGVYDTVSRMFFTNSGTGTFTAGPVVANTDVPANGTWSATWTANASNGVTAGTIYGEGLCNAVGGTYGVAATSAQTSSANWSNSGAGCWCRVTGVDDGDGVSAANGSWVFHDTFSSSGNCASNCAYYCVANVRGNASFMSAVFGM